MQEEVKCNPFLLLVVLDIVRWSQRNSLQSTLKQNGLQVKKIPQANLWSVVFWLLIGGDAVRVCAHLLVACHLVLYDREEKNGKCYVNRMFVWNPVWSLWCSICRRSSLKYEAWKWIKMGVKWKLWIKMADFLLEWQFSTPMFFVHLVMICMHT